MKIPVTIITGFLGAGKTTIIKSLLAQLSDRKIFVVVNEFGKVSIDAPLIEQHDSANSVEIAEINGGLVGYSDDQTFDELLNSIGKRGSELDHVVVETSGLAVPTAICERLNNCAQQFALDAVIAVVDTSAFLDGTSKPEFEQNVFVNQLQCSDICILNKIDNLNSDQLIAAESSLREIAPGMRFFETARHGKVQSDLLLGVHLHTTRQMQLVGATTASSHDWNPQEHSHEGWNAHDHGLHTHEHLHEHDPGWLSFSLHAHGGQDQARLVASLTALLRSEQVFRAKGFVVTASSDRMELQCVGDRIQLSPTSVRSEANDETEIVFIGYNISRDKIAEHLTASTGSEWH